MGRKLREYAPGVAFHITARMLGHWFKEKSAEAAECVILEGVASSDALLLAYAVMPNHFHIVLRAGPRPLGWVMQPLMRRLALIVNRAGSRRGPVFEGRFRSHACDDVDHLRRAIVYVHNNPLRKGLCTDASEYRWHSHSWYAGHRPVQRHFAGATIGLNLFACEPNDVALETLAINYLNYFAWRLEKDRCDNLLIPCAALEPEAFSGDVFFREHFCIRRPDETVRARDLRDRAIELLGDIDPAAELDSLRKPYLSRVGSRMRRELMCSLLQHGYAVGKIATLFRVSCTVVSRCASHLRYAC